VLRAILHARQKRVNFWVRPVARTAATTERSRKKAADIASAAFSLALPELE
jgi:hypothetical protein